MDAQASDGKLEQPRPERQPDAASAQAASEQIGQTPKQGEPVSDEHFELVVRDALEGVGGILLFKMRLEQENGCDHVAAAAIGDGADRRFLLLTLAAGATQLTVEPAAKSSNPLAKLAPSYAGLADAFAAAA